jgi:hypothetical protein
MIGHWGQYNSAVGEFAVQKNDYNWLIGSISTVVTGGDAGNIDFIPSVNVEANKTTYYLEPFRKEFLSGEAVDQGASVKNTLLNKEYAFTHLWDGAVTRDKVGKIRQDG